MNTITSSGVSFCRYNKTMKLAPLAIITPLIVGSVTASSNSTDNATQLFEINDSTKRYESPKLTQPKDGTTYEFQYYKPILVNNINS